MDLDQLISFYQTIKTGSFSKAAQKVFKSQSAISHQISNLEEELKVKLFERRNNKLLLTWEGKCLYDFVNRFLNEINDLKQLYDDAKEGKRGSLSIATTSVVCTYYLNNVIKKFIKQAPKTKFKLNICANVSEVQSMVLDGKADLGITAWCAPILPGKLNFFKWKRFERILFTSKEHPLAGRNDVTIDDIARYPLVLYREGSKLRKEVEESLNLKNLNYEIVIEMDDPDNLKRYVEMEIGITILSSIAITPGDKKKFSLINVNNLFNAIDYGVYYEKNKLFSGAMKKFLKVFDPALFNDEQFLKFSLV